MPGSLFCSLLCAPSSHQELSVKKPPQRLRVCSFARTGWCEMSRGTPTWQKVAQGRAVVWRHESLGGLLSVQSAKAAGSLAQGIPGPARVRAASATSSSLGNLKVGGWVCNGLHLALFCAVPRGRTRRDGCVLGCTCTRERPAYLRGSKCKPRFNCVLRCWEPRVHS